MWRPSSLLVAAALMTPLVALGPGEQSAAAEAEKITICHKPGTQAEETLKTSAYAVDGHLGHGDALGPCSDVPVIDPCEPNPCGLPNRTECVASEGTAVCLCDAGYVFNQNGECVVDDGFVTTPCHPNPCSATFFFRTICTVEDGLAHCLCDPGFVSVDGGDCVPGMWSCGG